MKYMDKIDKMMSRMIDYAVENPGDAPSRMFVINFGKSGMSTLFTPARSEILRTIIQKKPHTVGELVKELKRPKEAVSRDLRVLENYGLLSFSKTGRQKTPKVEKDIITMPLTA